MAMWKAEDALRGLLTKVPKFRVLAGDPCFRFELERARRRSTSKETGVRRESPPDIRQPPAIKIPVLVRSTGEVIDGHLRLKAARKLNITEVPVILSGLVEPPCK